MQEHNVFYNFNEAIRMPNPMKAHLIREYSFDEKKKTKTEQKHLTGL